MRSYDFSPFYRSSIGFDRMLELIGAASRPQMDDAGPPYDIERVGEERYRITMAAPGFDLDELSIVAERNVLHVEGKKRADETLRNFLHHGFNQRDFVRAFDLADFVIVTAASYENGMLQIELERELPEAMKPRRIEIGGHAERAPHRTEEKRLESVS
jgi:molecular chaperone IbpA